MSMSEAVMSMGSSFLKCPPRLAEFSLYFSAFLMLFGFLCSALSHWLFFCDCYSAAKSRADCILDSMLCNFQYFLLSFFFMWFLFAVEILYLLCQECSFLISLVMRRVTDSFNSWTILKLNLGCPFL